MKNSNENEIPMIKDFSNENSATSNFFEISDNLSSFFENQKFLKSIEYLENSLPSFFIQKPGLMYKIHKLHFFLLMKIHLYEEALQFFRSYLFEPTKKFFPNKFDQKMRSFQNIFVNRCFNSNFEKIFLLKIQNCFQILSSEVHNYIYKDNAVYFNNEDSFMDISNQEEMTEDSDFEGIVANLYLLDSSIAHYENISQFSSFVESQKYSENYIAFNINSIAPLEEKMNDGVFEVKEITDVKENVKGKIFNVSKNYDKIYYKSSSGDDLKNVKKRNKFFRNFNPKFTKRENIDKKIMRSFRKYFKNNNRKNQNLVENLENPTFWNQFINEDLMPPMVLNSHGKKIEFKSFSSSYMIWIFSQLNSNKLYEVFFNDNGKILFESILLKYERTIIENYTNEEIEEIKKSLYYYMVNLSKLWNITGENRFNEESSLENSQSMPPLNPNFEGSQIVYENSYEESQISAARKKSDTCPENEIE